MKYFILCINLILVFAQTNAQKPSWAEYTTAHSLETDTILERPLLVILVKFHDLNNTYSRDHIINKFFNPAHRNVTGYFQEISYGKFTYKTDKIVDWIIPPDDPDTELNESLESEYWNSKEISHGKKNAYLLSSVNNIVDFSKYDIDHDRIVSSMELSLLLIYPSKLKINFAFKGKVNRITLDSCKIDIRNAAVIEEISELGTCIHELTHLFTPVNSQPGDLYPFIGDRDYQSPETFTVLANYNGIAPAIPHLDPYSKYHSGWINYIEIAGDSRITLNDVETHPEVYRINNPDDPYNEYVLLENRWPGNSYEGNMDGIGRMNDTGLALWHIKENGFGLTSSNGSSLGFRDRIKLLRPPGADNSNKKFLWDGNEVSQITWDWSDNSSSGVYIRFLSPYGSKMSAYIDLPG